MKLQTGKDVKIEYSDRGGEFVSNEQKLDALVRGAELQLSAPRAPQTNSEAERANRTLDEAISTTMHQAQAPSSFWAEANNWVVWTHNRLPYVRDDKGQWWSRKDLFDGTRRPVNFDLTRIWGCTVWRYFPKKHREGPKSHLRLKCHRCVFVGYDSPDGSVYRLWDPKHRKIVLASANHTIACEDEFPWFSKRVWSEEDEAMPPSFVIPEFGTITPEMCDTYKLP